MDNKICQIHNEPVQFCEKDAQQKLQLMCRFCIQKKFNVKNIDDVDDEQKQLLKQLELKFDQSINQLKDFADKLEKYTQLIQKQLKKFKQSIELNIYFLNEKKNEIKSKNNDSTSLLQYQFDEEKIIINNQFTQIKQQLEIQLKELEISIKLDQLYQSFYQLSFDASNKDNEGIQQQQIEVFNNKFNYQLMQSYKQSEQLWALAFNKDATIMIAGCFQLIKVFKFKDGKITEIQQLNEHSNHISCLQFMKKSNQFISGSYDSTMRIWEKNQNNQYRSNQVLKSHSSQINCITMNQNEDLLISGSDDKTIKFWTKQRNSWRCQSIDCKSLVYSISLNDQEDQLIASLDDYQILLIQQQSKDWIMKQKIQVEQFGFRLCFVNENQFVFQPCDTQYLMIFDYDHQDKTYKQGQKLQYSNNTSENSSKFPIRFIPQIGLIMVKNGDRLQLIRRSQNGQFAVEQSINFGTRSLYGGITDDGRYIATWDFVSKEIQLRQFEY